MKPQARLSTIDLRMHFAHVTVSEGVTEPKSDFTWQTEGHETQTLGPAAVFRCVAAMAPGSSHK